LNWRKHSEKRPVALDQISVGKTSFKIFEDIRDILQEN